MFNQRIFKRGTHCWNYRCDNRKGAAMKRNVSPWGFLRASQIQISRPTQILKLREITSIVAGKEFKTKENVTVVGIHSLYDSSACGSPGLPQWHPPATADETLIMGLTAMGAGLVVKRKSMCFRQPFRANCPAGETELGGSPGTVSSAEPTLRRSWTRGVAGWPAGEWEWAVVHLQSKGFPGKPPCSGYRKLLPWRFRDGKERLERWKRCRPWERLPRNWRQLQSSYCPYWPRTRTESRRTFLQTPREWGAGGSGPACRRSFETINVELCIDHPC